MIIVKKHGFRSEFGLEAVLLFHTEDQSSLESDVLTGTVTVRL